MKVKEMKQQKVPSLNIVEDFFSPDKESHTPDSTGLKSVKRKEEVSENLFSGLDEDDEPFTPGKENFTANALFARSKLRMLKMKDIKRSSSHKSSSLGNILAPPIHEQDLLQLSSKYEINFKAKFGTRSLTERLPFQPLFVHINGKSKSEASVLSSAIIGSGAMSCYQAMEIVKNPVNKVHMAGEKKKWQMVVDTTTFLNKNSRKSLQLLRGLKGTQLIIPRIAEAFRESLVNPLSERFLWNDSSPRGLIWSCSDDVFLKEKL